MGKQKKKKKKQNQVIAAGDGAETSISFIETAVTGIRAFSERHKTLLQLCVIAAIILIGIFIRLNDLSHWYENRERAFVENQPLHTTFDAWFYLSLAKDIKEGTYHPVDEKRGVPASPPRPVPPPLLSVIGAGIAKITPFSLSWVGAILPAVIGPLVVIPVFLLGKFLGGYMMAVSASLLCVLYPFYVIRSNLGWFDTDGLIITFCLLLSWLFIRFGTAETHRKYLFLFYTVVVYLLFLWWWDQAPAVVTAIYFLMFGVTLALFYRPGRTEGMIFFGSIGICFAVFTAVKGVGVFVDIFNTLWSKYLYITQYTGVYPNIGVTISEQARPSLPVLINSTTTNLISFLFASAGVVLLHLKKIRYALVLLPVTVIAFLAITYANRFMLFLVPMLALGAGYLLSVLWQLRGRFRVVGIVCPLLVIYFAVIAFYGSKAFVSWPKEHGRVASGMVLASEITPPDSVIWAWWDHGYAITYLARRATINDGSIHSGERTLYNALPMQVDNQRMSANFMHFYVNSGMQGIRLVKEAMDWDRGEAMALLEKILAAGPEEARQLIAAAELKDMDGFEDVDDWLRFFFPGVTRPVYFFLDNLLTRTAYWWYWFATWDFDSQTGTHPLYRVYYGVSRNDTIITGQDGLVVDMENGVLHTDGRQIMLSEIVIRTRTGTLSKSFETESPVRFDLYEPAGMGVLLDNDIARSVFHRLFVLHLPEEDYFKPVELRLPFYQLWEVKADMFDG